MALPEQIEAVALLGWKVYPCSRSTKAGMFKGASAAATDDLNQLARWSNEYPRCNWRVVFGPSGIWGLDCDVPPGHAHDGIAALAGLVNTHGLIPPRPQARSGGGGLGLFFAHQGEKIIGEGGHPAPGIDPRRGQQSQTIPPSIHVVTRRSYRWLVPPWEVAPPKAPDWLLRLLQPAPEPEWKRAPIDTSDDARRRLYRAAHAIADAAPGTRNAVLNGKAYQMGRLIGAGLLGEHEAVDAMYAAAKQAGLDHIEIAATIRSGITSGRRKPQEDRNAR
jgi:hypothetical protein